MHRTLYMSIYSLGYCHMQMSVLNTVVYKSWYMEIHTYAVMKALSDYTHASKSVYLVNGECTKNEPNPPAVI